VVYGSLTEDNDTNNDDEEGICVRFQSIDIMVEQSQLGRNIRLIHHVCSLHLQKNNKINSFMS